MELKFLEQFTKADYWVLAVSGGSDSMALMCYIHEFVSNLTCCPRIIIATADHGTGNMATFACNWVAKWAKSFGFDFVTTIWRDKSGGNFYNNARDFRYNFLSSICREYDEKYRIKHAEQNCPKKYNGVIFTAHHMQDNVETVLMNIERGSGIDGICGIPRISSLDGVLLIRPMLTITKCEIRKYLSERNFPWIEDRANTATRFRRAFYRHKILPELGALFQQRVDLLAKNACVAKDALNHYAQIEYNRCVMPDARGVILNMDTFVAIPLEIQRRIIVKLITFLHKSRKRPRLRNLDHVLSYICKKKYAILCGVHFVRIDDETIASLVDLGRARNQITCTHLI